MEKVAPCDMGGREALRNVMTKKIPEAMEGEFFTRGPFKVKFKPDVEYNKLMRLFFDETLCYICQFCFAQIIKCRSCTKVVCGGCYLEWKKGNQKCDCGKPNADVDWQDVEKDDSLNKLKVKCPIDCTCGSIVLINLREHLRINHPDKATNIFGKPDQGLNLEAHERELAAHELTKKQSEYHQIVQQSPERKTLEQTVSSLGSTKSSQNLIASDYRSPISGAANFESNKMSSSSSTGSSYLDDPITFNHNDKRMLKTIFLINSSCCKHKEDLDTVCYYLLPRQDYASFIQLLPDLLEKKRYGLSLNQLRSIFNGTTGLKHLGMLITESAENWEEYRQCCSKIEKFLDVSIKALAEMFGKNKSVKPNDFLRDLEDFAESVPLRDVWLPLFEAFCDGNDRRTFYGYGMTNEYCRPQVVVKEMVKSGKAIRPIFDVLFFSGQSLARKRLEDFIDTVNCESESPSSSRNTQSTKYMVVSDDKTQTTEVASFESKNASSKKIWSTSSAGSNYLEEPISFIHNDKRMLQMIFTINSLFITSKSDFGKLMFAYNTSRKDYHSFIQLLPDLQKIEHYRLSLNKLISTCNDWAVLKHIALKITDLLRNCKKYSSSCSKIEQLLDMSITSLAKRYDINKPDKTNYFLLRLKEIAESVPKRDVWFPLFETFCDEDSRSNFYGNRGNNYCNPDVVIMEMVGSGITIRPIFDVLFCSGNVLKKNELENLLHPVKCFPICK